jgi:hypothetical protein
MTLAINSSPQHRPLPIDARINNQKIIIPWKPVLVDQMATPLLPVAAHFFAAFDEASEDLLTTVTLSCDERVVIFGDVQAEEVCGGEVCFAFRAAVAVGLVVMSFILGV